MGSAAGRRIISPWPCGRGVCSDGKACCPAFPYAFCADLSDPDIAGPGAATSHRARASRAPPYWPQTVRRIDGQRGAGSKAASIRAEVPVARGWTGANLTFALRSGMMPDGDVFGGGTAEVVQAVTSFLDDADRETPTVKGARPICRINREWQPRLPRQTQMQGSPPWSIHRGRC